MGPQTMRHLVEPIERDFEINTTLDRIEADIRTVIAAGATYQLERRLVRIMTGDALGASQSEGTMPSGVG